MYFGKFSKNEGDEIKFRPLLSFHPNFISNSGAVAAFKRALTTWRCATKVNFDVDDINIFPETAQGNWYRLVNLIIEGLCIMMTKMVETIFRYLVTQLTTRSVRQIQWS